MVVTFYLINAHGHFNKAADFNQAAVLVSNYISGTLLNLQ